MISGVMDTLLNGDNMVQRANLNLNLGSRSTYATDTLTLFFRMAVLRTKLLSWLPIQ